MKFRPCIDIHNGTVKQIVGGTLRDAGNQAQNNFVSSYDAAFYAKMYQRDGLRGGHIILLNAKESPWYQEDIAQAAAALAAYPGGMQLGGGVTCENAESFLDMGASHVIVTSFVFHHGKIDRERLRQLVALVGKERLVLDVSCRRYPDGYYIMTDRWQKKTHVRLEKETMEELCGCCDEFLVHAVDVEGRQEGIERPLIPMLAAYAGRPVTYAGGIRSMDDLAYICEKGEGRINFTVGSALDLFGGGLPYQDLVAYDRTSSWILSKQDNR